MDARAVAGDTVRVWATALALGIGVTFAAGYASADGFPPPTYSAKAIRATVVDGETGRPLEGVVIMAQWVLRRMGGDGSKLQVTEAVTTLGQFFIPGWGPKPRPPLMELRNKSPELRLFKHGYTPLRLVSESKATFIKRPLNYRRMTAREISDWMSIEGNPAEPVQDSFWDGATIQLEPFRGTQEKFLQLLESHVWAITNDDAPHVRAFLKAIRAERDTFDPNSLSPGNRDLLVGLFQRVDELLR